ncbi:hypothetical protein RB595_005421 [Gaeumannomyces hyphopodioides]
MKFSLLPLLGLAGSALSSASAAAAEPPTAAVLVTIPASHAIPNPNALAAATRATLSARGGPRLSAPLTAANGFVFPRVPPGSYLLDVHSASHAFAPLRVDVAPAGAGVGASAGRKQGEQQQQQLAVSAWETFRGNDWGNKGEAARRAEDAGAFEVRCLGRKEYYMERSSFSVLSILKNPMILLAMVSMGIFLGMPYLLENMDPEVRAEFEARQKSNPMSSVLGGGGQPGGGFDMAAFLAGSNNGPKREDASTPPPQPSAGNGGGKKNQRR